MPSQKVFNNVLSIGGTPQSVVKPGSKADIVSKEATVLPEIHE